MVKDFLKALTVLILRLVATFVETAFNNTDEEERDEKRHDY